MALARAHRLFAAWPILACAMFGYGCYDRVSFDFKRHPCGACRSCEVCVAAPSGPPSCLPRKAQARLACDYDNQRVWLDSCGNINTVVEQCSSQAQCVGPDDQNPEASCRCRNHWQGTQCSVCPNQFSVESDCTGCAGRFEGESCDMCPDHFDPQPTCSTCRNHWQGANCDVCPGHFDAASDCASCRNHWQGAACDSCPSNFDPASDCSTCSASFVGDSCSACRGRYAPPQCAACTGNWDPLHDCASCRPGYVDDANDCGTCAPGYRSGAAGSCVEFCGDGIQTASEDCDDGNDIALDGCDGCLLTPFRVHAPSSDTFNEPSVASAPDGTFVVVWIRSSGIHAILGRKFAADGHALGDTLAINESEPQFNPPRVVMADDGGFVAAWLGPSSGVMARRFDANVKAVGGEFHLDQTGDTPSAPIALAGTGDGGVSVAFSVGNYIFVRSYDSSNQPTNSLSAGAAHAGASPAVHDPGLAVLPGGAPLIVYAQQSRYLEIGGGYDFSDNVMINQGGMESYAEIGGGPGVTQSTPAVAMTAAGNFAVAWIALTGSGSSPGLRGRWFARDRSAGAFLQFGQGLVDTRPALVAIDRQHVAVAWLAGSLVAFAVFDDQGAMVRPAHLIDKTVVTEPPAIARGPDGGLIVVWSELDQILCQRFDAEDKPLLTRAP